MYKKYFSEIMRPPEFRGPGSGEPPEPWLMLELSQGSAVHKPP